MLKQFSVIVIWCLSIALGVSGQNQATDDSIAGLTLQQCIDYALSNQPALHQAILGVSIARETNSIALSQWLPQVNGTATLTHYLQQPTSFFSNTPGGAPVPTKTAVINTFIPELTATQNIFSPQLLYAEQSAHLYVKAAEQITDSTQINLVFNVSEAYYNLLQNLEQIKVLKEDTARLNKNVSDTYHQYKSGIVDETDYDEAVISLNNSLAQLKQANENVVPLYASLKQEMGFPPVRNFNVSFDTLTMMNDIAFDTLEQLQFEKRIEYQQLQTAIALQKKETDYYGYAFLPTVSAFFDYDYEYENNDFSKLLTAAYPYSYVGLTLSIPIFTGFARLENERRSRLQEQVLGWADTALKSEIYTDYTTSLANYKSNLYNLEVMKGNEDLAKKVYGIVTLQYLQGIVAYLNVITAEDNLISSEIGYINALFLVLSSKISLEKAMGDITVRH